MPYYHTAYSVAEIVNVKIRINFRTRNSLSMLL